MNAHPVPRVEVHESADELATAVAGAFLRLLTVRQAAGAAPGVGLTGGTIADQIHREIARLAPGSDVDWGRISFYWGDERFVAPDSDERNAKQARAAFLDVLGVDPARVHEIPSTADADSVEAAATAYSDTVRSEATGALDLLMLGVGPDGHIASLFPDRPEILITDRVAVAVRDSPKPPPERVTLTRPVINGSRRVWLVLAGTDKAAALGLALAGASYASVPAAGAKGRRRTIFFVDDAAASQVPPELIDQEY